MKNTLHLLTIFAAAAAAATTTTTARSARVPAIFVFGDSTADVGNNNFLAGDAPKANFLPYGIDYYGSIPTGRFSNGFLAIDYIARALGFTGSPQPFLAVEHGFEMQELLLMRGVNFASAGSGILDAANQDVIPMGKQIADFGAVAGSIALQVGRPSADLFLAESLFFLSTGSNDLFQEFAFSDPGEDDPTDQIITPIINKLKDQLTMLHNLGARKIAVAGTGVIGCIPAFRISDPLGDCNEDLNALSLRFKDATKALLKDLSSNLTGFEYAFLDLYEIASSIASVPFRSGFREMKAACCGSGRLNAEFPCGPNSAYCSNRSDYFFWDAVHPTDAANTLMAEMSVYNVFKLLQNKSSGGKLSSMFTSSFSVKSVNKQTIGIN